MFSIDKFHASYETESTQVAINGRNFSFLTPASIERFIDPVDIMNKFPLWAKIWEASGILADHLSRIPPNPDEHMLELGSGLGVSGIIAATFGHRVTLTEYNPDALNFARANALINNCPQIQITSLDWNNPHIEGKFDWIIGSEIIYKQKDIESIHHLIQRYLKPDGKVLIAESMRKTGLDFYKSMSPHFNIRSQKKILKSDETQITVILTEMTLKR